MEISISFLITGLVALAAGSFLGYYARQTIAKNQLRTAEGRVAKILEEAEKKEEEITLNAKKKAVEILEQAKREEREREQMLHTAEQRLEKRETLLNQRMEDVESEKKDLAHKSEEAQKMKAEAEEARTREMERLEKIAGLSKEQAKTVLLQLTEDENRTVLAERIAKIQQENADEVEKQARNIMTQAIQKYSRSHAADVMTSTLSIPSEEIKGKIIGKEGRNIRTLERLTGVEIIIDDTPDSIVISAFDPVRRETAKIALEKLIEDGRIHPAKIEETVAWAEKEVDGRVREAGEAAAYEAGIAGLNPKLLYILGRLRYRTSYKQNVLLHSLEVSYLAGALAAELGCDVKVAKMGGLFHDIGKSVDHEVQGTHVNIGMKILEKFGIDPNVVLAMRSHHEEYPYATPEAFIVTAADALSAARPGARRDTVENYIKRLEELEAIATSFPAVEKCYAISAGREIRVFVKPENIDDLGALKLARSIADKIEAELKYPGEIKVNVLRETRAVEYAR